MTRINALLPNHVAAREIGSSDTDPTQAITPQSVRSDSRRPYQAPSLTAYGDVRDVTMGPTVGFGESGGGPFCAEGVNCP